LACYVLMADGKEAFCTKFMMEIMITGYTLYALGILACYWWNFLLLLQDIIRAFLCHSSPSLYHVLYHYCPYH
jgi:hypothetical protein